MTIFDRALAAGTLIETWAEGQLRADRWSIIRLADQPPGNGHGPRLDKMNLPDLQIMKHGVTFALEVKGKTGATLGRLSGKPEHGVNQDAWDSYLQYDRQIMPTFLLIVEAGHDWTARTPFIARVNTLGVRQSAIRGRPVVYWPREQMRPNWLAVLNRHVNQRLQRPARQRRQEAAP